MGASLGDAVGGGSSRVLGIGLLGTAATATADDFNPQPDPPGKPIAISNFERFNARFLPPDPCRSSCGLPAVDVHKNLITRFDIEIGGAPKSAAAPAPG